MTNKGVSSNTTRRFEYTEEEMGHAFEKALIDTRGVNGIGNFSRVFREVNCQRGRPDFIAFKPGSSDFLSGEAFKLKYSGSLVLSFLHQRAPRTQGYLVAQSGLTMRAIKAALDELVSRQYVIVTPTGSFLLNSAMTLHDIEVWAFELKLDKPKRAVFQAQQYRSFAQNVLIVVPPSQIPLYAKFNLALRRWGIGLASFEPTFSEFILYRAPRLCQANSRHQQAYALFQLLGEPDSGER